ncbi:hypothetical protein LXL04_031520 [Taraxacum kok-saghyz]
MAESYVDYFIGTKGLIKVEFVRLILESLHTLGYKKSVEYLEEESGIALSSSEVKEFTQHILNGNWEESLNSLKKIPAIDESAVKSSSFIILEQKFFDLLNEDDVEKALRTLRKDISSLSINENQVRELSSFLLLSNQRPMNPKPRSEVLRDLKKLFPPKVMIPELRLLHLIHQALDYQHDSCPFHNSVHEDISLLIDHTCGKGLIPSHTSQILRHHYDEVWFLEFSHNGRFLATSSKDRYAYTWQVSLSGSVQFKHQLSGHWESVSCVSWSPDDSQLLSCGVEEVVRRWDVFTGGLLFVYGKNNLGTISCSWSPDGQRVFTGFNDQSITMWDLNGNQLQSWTGQKTRMISDLQITSDGNFIISICQETMILLLNRESGEEKIIKEDHNIVSFSLSRDKKFLLVSLVNQEIHLWDIEESRRVPVNYKGHKSTRFVVKACFGGPEDIYVASGSEDSRVFIWRRDTGEIIDKLEGHSGAVNCVCWNPRNPEMLASASDDGTVRIWHSVEWMKVYEPGIEYQNDALFIGQWSHSNLQNLSRILKCFHASSGLKVNFHKSRVFGVGVPDTETSDWAKIFGCEAGSFPFTYLGVPIGANMNLKKNWKPILDKFEAKLSTWKSKTFSFGGRLTSISSVLGNLPTYYLSLFKAPIAITKELEKIRRRFLWGGDKEKKKIHWVSWEKVSARKSDGGLGVAPIRSLNTGLLVKWWWRLKCEKEALWAKTIKGIHNLHGKPHDYLVNKNSHGVWQNIVSEKKEINKLGVQMNDIFKLSIKSGENTLFWGDKWLGMTSLKDKYPVLYNLESRKTCTIADRFYDGSFSGHWSSQEIEEEDGAQQLESLMTDLESLEFQPGEDQWQCILDSSGAYSVGALRHKFDQLLNQHRELPSYKWHKISPIKREWQRRREHKEPPVSAAPTPPPPPPPASPLFSYYSLTYMYYPHPLPMGINPLSDMANKNDHNNLADVNTKAAFGALAEKLPVS